MTNEQEKSDLFIVAMKLANKPGRPGAESAEPREGTEGNAGEQHTCRTQSRESVSNRCRVVLDTNRYSVPALYASARLTLKLFADRLCIFHGANLVATHPRSYARHRDFENPDHIKELPRP
jgi:hypothetical protein